MFNVQGSMGSRLRRKILRLYKFLLFFVFFIPLSFSLFQLLRENGEVLSEVKLNKSTHTFSSRSEASNFTNICSIAHFVSRAKGLKPICTISAVRHSSIISSSVRKAFICLSQFVLQPNGNPTELFLQRKHPAQSLRFLSQCCRQ